MSSGQKDAEAFRTISEVAEALNLPQHVLRFWETRFTQIKPMKRAGGRRFYRPQDVELLGAIRQLLYGDGFTIKGVQRILREQGPKAVAALAHTRGDHVGLPVESGPDPMSEPVVLDLEQPPEAVLRAVLEELASCRRMLSEIGAEPRP